ncbi:MAG: DMT family transporter [Neomegalonema sp.]|nr:DMT family transporter [Neomegalonema sp.]
MTRNTLLLTVLAMLAFAANSLLTREALRGGAIDAASFGAIRLASGALMLSLLVMLTPQRGGAVRAALWRRGEIDLISALCLFGYVALFSFAYLRLAAGTGALLLFGAVQLTMIGLSLIAGERYAAQAWIGIVASILGLVLLLLPGLDAPDPASAVIMVGGGICWGIYSLRGRRAGDPLRATTRNFALASVPALILLALVAAELIPGAIQLTGRGAWLAIASGTLASGLGYAIWYRALPALGAGRAGVVQLSVPVITALLAAVSIHEPITLRMALCASIILGGIALVLRAPKRS